MHTAQGEGVAGGGEQQMDGGQQITVDRLGWYSFVFLLYGTPNDPNIYMCLPCRCLQ